MSQFNTKHSMTIRLGASRWDATLSDGTVFDFSTMTHRQANDWYGAFLASVYQVYGHNDRRRSHPLPQGGRGRGRGRRSRRAGARG